MSYTAKRLHCTTPMLLVIGVFGVVLSALWTATSASAQIVDQVANQAAAQITPQRIRDSLLVVGGTDAESLLSDTLRIDADSLMEQPVIVHTHKAEKQYKTAGIPTQFVPDPQRALWLGLVCPGAGQIYNRKYWKLPIFYGGFLGCVYAFTWNQQQYMDYSQAYLDLMDDNPATQSYLNMFPEGYDISGREEQYKNIFKRRKDFYRRNRDISAFCFIGVYLLSVIDAYVDAGLSVFDISTDLSLQLQPAVINQQFEMGARSHNSYGLGCALTF